MDGATGALDIVQRMTNVSGQEQSYCFWDRTLCKAGGFTIIPLNNKSRFPASGSSAPGRSWTAKSTPTGGSTTASTPRIRASRSSTGWSVAKSQGKEQKIGADSDAGWFAYIRGRCSS
jgi:hypothetical protein